MSDYIEKLKSFDNHKLIDIVKNHKQYGYDESLRETAIEILGERGVSIEQLQLTGNFVNNNFQNAEILFKDFRKYSKNAFICYILIFIFQIAAASVDSNATTLSILLIILTWANVILYFVFLVKSFVSESNFFKALGKNQGFSTALLYVFIGMPLYFLMFFYFNKQMKDEMMLIR